MVREAFAGEPSVGVETFDGLLVEFAARHGASAIVRGLRAVSDFEYEFQMALMNRRLDARVETVFMMPAAEYSYISSRLVKEVVMLGGTVAGLVPEAVEQRLHARRAGA
jgi:pantetheine-phosphate adenylyltransferase